jgi:hypothetical protein
MNAMFAYDDAVAERYPTIGAGLVRATGLDNGLSSSELLDEYRAEQRAVSERLKATAIADLPSIAMAPGPCPVRRQPTQYRSAAEALLRRLAKHGDLPTISTLVDIGNLVSIRYAIPVAMFDPANIAGSTERAAPRDPHLLRGHPPWAIEPALKQRRSDTCHSSSYVNIEARSAPRSPRQTRDDPNEDAAPRSAGRPDPLEPPERRGALRWSLLRRRGLGGRPCSSAGPASQDSGDLFDSVPERAA